MIPKGEIVVVSYRIVKQIVDDAKRVTSFLCATATAIVLT